jgi:hypothetical protein
MLSLQLEIKIPLVQLTFPSVAGMRRIPKKRPAPTDSDPTPTATTTTTTTTTTSPGCTPPEPKKRKQDSKVKLVVYRLWFGAMKRLEAFYTVLIVCASNCHYLP